MRENAREVELEEFVQHLDTGEEAWEFVKEYECRLPMRDLKDYDPPAAEPQPLPDLEAGEMDEEPLC